MSLRKYRRLEEDFISNMESPPEGKFKDKGIVTACGSKECYYVSAYVLVRMLRHLGCDLPVEVWKFDWERDEMWDSMFESMEGVSVRMFKGRVCEGIERNGWSLKPFAIMESSFREVLFLDSDVVPVQNPSFMFDWEEYKKKGAVFWADTGLTHKKTRPTDKNASNNVFWHLADCKEVDEPEFESGQVLVDKTKCWRELSLTCHYNRHADWYYKFFWGDKETFHLAWRRLRTDFCLVDKVVSEEVPGGWWFHQPDPWGNLLFQHRCGNKFVFENNLTSPEFVNQSTIFEFIDELKDSVRSARHSA